MPSNDQPPRRTERKALWFMLAVVAVLLVLFFVVDWGLETAPTVSEGGESPTNAAPYEVEPPEPAVD